MHLMPSSSHFRGRRPSKLAYRKVLCDTTTRGPRSVFARGKRRKEHTRPFFFHRPTLLSPFSVSAPTRFSRLPARGRNKKGSRRKYFDESPDAYETFFSREFYSQRRVLLCREGVRGTEKRRKRLYLEATGPTQVRTRTGATSTE